MRLALSKLYIYGNNSLIYQPIFKSEPIKDRGDQYHSEYSNKFPPKNYVRPKVQNSLRDEITKNRLIALRICSVF